MNSKQSSKPIISLSLDLDNLWSYLKVHGDPWDNFPSYFPIAIPRILKLLNENNIKTTFFIVGQDAIIDTNKMWLEEITTHGHEVGNHSFHHEPWIKLLAEDEILAELQQAHESIANACKQEPIGFRAPGFANGLSLMNAVSKMNYQFDASLWPTIITPLARLYYRFNQTKLDNKLRKQQEAMYGSMKNGFLPLKPFHWHTSNKPLLEIPVTTVPILRTPFHLTYLVWLSQFSESLSLNYLRQSLRLCRLFNITPSFLLHPPDFLGNEDAPGLSFFPGMNISAQKKIHFVQQVFNEIQRQFEVVTMSQHALMIQQHGTNKKVRILT